jgi:hypothetical protein
MRTLLVNKKADKLAIRLYRMYLRMSDDERGMYDKKVFTVRQDKLWKKAHQLCSSKEFGTKLLGYELWMRYFDREMAWAASQHMLALTDALKDIRREWKRIWNGLFEESK